MYSILTENNNLNVSEIILIIVLLCLAIIFCLYGIMAARRVSLAAKKFDYFIEDLTYKSELLNPSVDTIVKVSNYSDILEAFMKRNVKAWAKVVSNNKDVAYKLLDKLKDFSSSEEEK